MGYANGCKFKTNLDFTSLMQWWEKPRRRNDTVGFATEASLVDGAFIIRHYGKDVCRVLSGNIVEFIHPYNSRCTRFRLNTVLWHNMGGPYPSIYTWRDGTGDHTQVANYRNGPKLQIDPENQWYGVVCTLPIEAGWRSDFQPTMTDLYLSLGCRLGDPRASETLAKRLDSMGFAAMAKTILDYKGVRYAWMGMFRHMTKLYRAIQEEPYATDEQQKPGPMVKDEDGNEKPGPSLADQGISSGLWLADPYAHGGPLFGMGELVRPLSIWDVLIEGADPQAKQAVIDGKTYDIVDGAAYHAMLDKLPRRIGIRPQRLKIRSSKKAA